MSLCWILARDASTKVCLDPCKTGNVVSESSLDNILLNFGSATSFCLFCSSTHLERHNCGSVAGLTPSGDVGGLAVGCEGVLGVGREGELSGG